VGKMLGKGLKLGMGGDDVNYFNQYAPLVIGAASVGALCLVTDDTATYHVSPSLGPCLLSVVSAPYIMASLLPPVSLQNKS
jgi:hypothetical protein